MLKIVVSEKFLGSKIVSEGAKKLGYEVLIHKNEKEPLSGEELECDVIAQLDMINHNNIDDLKKLKYVCTAMVGTDSQPVDELKKRGILYTNCKGVYDVPIAEFVVMRVLEMFKYSKTYENEQRKHSWHKRFDLHELTGKRAVIVGTGGIGTETAKRLNAFGVKCIGFSKGGKLKEYFNECYKIEMLSEKISEADIVVLCVPADKNTYRLFNEEMFDKMKNGSVIVNVGRGAVIDENALYNALKNGRLLGAAIDVFEKEPLDAQSPLWELENFYFSPHNSFNSNLNGEKMAEYMLENLKRFKEGKELFNLV